MRNKRQFYAAAFSHSEDIKDEYGNISGEQKLFYLNPKKLFGNISAAHGETEARQFGNSIDYDKVIVLDDPKAPIDEYSILWIDGAPELDEDGALALNDNGEVKTPHDYIVKKVARSLNNVSVAISRVTVR